MNQAEMLARFAREGDFDCLLVAGRYTLIDHTGLRELLPTCERRGISVIIGGPYNSGILATGARPGATYNYVEALPAVMEKVAAIEAVCARHQNPTAGGSLAVSHGPPRGSRNHSRRALRGRSGGEPPPNEPAHPQRLLGRTPALKPVAPGSANPASIDQRSGFLSLTYLYGCLYGCPMFAPAYMGRKRRGAAPSNAMRRPASRR